MNSSKAKNKKRKTGFVSRESYLVKKIEVRSQKSGNKTVHCAPTPESYFFNSILDTRYDILTTIYYLLTTNLIGELET